MNLTHGLSLFRIRWTTIIIRDFIVIFLTNEYAYMQMYFIDGTAGRRILMGVDARELTRELAKEVRTFTARADIKADNVSFGVIRQVPGSFFYALDRVRKAAGGCNYKSILKAVPHFEAITARVSP